MRFGLKQTSQKVTQSDWQGGLKNMEHVIHATCRPPHDVSSLMCATFVSPIETQRALSGHSKRARIDVVAKSAVREASTLPPIPKPFSIIHPT